MHSALVATLMEQGILTEPVKQQAREWRTELKRFASMIENRDVELMISGVKLLLELKIPNAWMKNQFSAASQEYIWEYIQGLYRLAVRCQGTDEGKADENESAPGDEKDEQDEQNAPEPEVVSPPEIQSEETNQTNQELPEGMADLLPKRFVRRMHRTVKKARESGAEPSPNQIMGILHDLNMNDLTHVMSNVQRNPTLCAMLQPMAFAMMQGR
jgi:hypothetical protein